MTVCGGAVAELTVTIFTPTFDRAVVEKGACVLETCSHLHGRSTCAKRGSQDRCGSISVCAVAGLTVSISTPTRHFSTV